MRRVMKVALGLAMLGQPHAEENRGSANYMLPLCKAWLKVMVDRDIETIKSLLREPFRLTMAGMCAGTVVGISETLRMVELICPPDGVGNDQLVRMVVTEIEKHPERPTRILWCR
jgi:Rap1a immunity proteins